MGYLPGSLVSSLEISGSKVPTMKEDGLYCGYRHMKLYTYTAKLSLIKEGREMSSVALTNPELVMPEPTDAYTFFYQPHDIDGDGKVQEFIILRYGSCDRDWLEFIRPDESGNLLEKIPVFNTQGEQQPYIPYVHSEGLSITPGKITTEYYSNSIGASGGVVKKLYLFDPIKKALVEEEKQVSSLN